MKIIEVIPQLSSGGAERFTVDLCNELSYQGHEIHLVLLYDTKCDRELGFYLSELSHEVYLHELGKRKGFDFRTMIKLNRLIKKLSPDVVHTHLRSLPYIIPSLLFKRNIRYFHTIHNDASREASDQLNRKTRKFAFCYKLCMPITISTESDRSFMEYYGSEVDRKMIVNGRKKTENLSHCPIEISDAKKNGKKVIVNIARLEKQKNQKSLVDAVRDMPDMEVFIIGNEKTSYGIEISKVLPKNVKLLGQKANAIDYMHHADAFILSSIYEGMPITLIECFSVGTFPIVTPVGGNINMVQDGVNGIVAISSSSSDIKKAIQRFLNCSKEELEKIRDNSKKSFNRYCIETCAKEYLKCFANK